jgi:2-polyprenyl-3-methyl-5-hydroxy-6-metoxy-1,4-benzoquinol methylase
MLDREAFIALSHYTRPVDHKKLGFIYDVLTGCADSRPPGKLDVLEIGCGQGGVTVPLAAVTCSVDAVDIDAGELAELRRRLGGRTNVAMHQSDGAEFNRGTEYDVIVASEVFAFVKHPTDLAQHLVSLLRRPGMLIVTTPNGFGPYEMRSRHLNPVAYLRRWNWLRRRLGKPEHVYGAGRDSAQFYSRGRLLRVLRSTGLRPFASSNSDALLTLLGNRYDRSVRLGTLDILLADRLPYWMVSGWYFALLLGEWCVSG